MYLKIQRLQHTSNGQGWHTHSHTFLCEVLDLKLLLNLDFSIYAHFVSLALSRTPLNTCPKLITSVSVNFMNCQIITLQILAAFFFLLRAIVSANIGGKLSFLRKFSVACYS